MKREILFRGKRMDNGEWVYGYFVFSETDNSAVICTNNGAIDVDPDTVGQYTGMTLNGKKVFEGDILCVDDTKEDPHGEFPLVFGVVKFGEYKVDYTENVGFYVDWLDNWYGDFSKDYRNDLCYWINSCQSCEVRGNIHDNPELLEVQG